MIKVKAEVIIIERNEQEKALADQVYLEVYSHWNYDSLVRLSINGKDTYITVNASDLKAAINSCTNTNRHGY